MGSDLTEGGILKTILTASTPMVVAFTLQSAFNIVDAFFVGKISAEALAAVSVSYPVVFLIISLGTGVGMGAASVVARFIGAGSQKMADNAAEHAVLAAGVLGVLLTVSGYLAAPTLFDWMGVGGTLKAMALSYLNILLFFAAFMLMVMVGNSILRGEGDMKTPMKVMGFAALLNIVLDPLFIFGFGWGVEGAAWATVVARFVGLAYLTYHIFSGKSWITLDLRNFTYDFDYVKRIFEVGIPSSLSNITMSVGMFLFTTIVGFFGTEALAAFGIGFRLDTLAILPALGVSVAVVSIVGQSIGAGKTERARKITVKAGIMSSALMTVTGFFFYVFAPNIITVFNSDPEVVRHGVSFLRIIPFSYLVVGVSIAFSGAFLGSGKAVYALAATASRVIVFSVPAAYLLSRVHGVSGVWMGILAGSFLGFVVSVVLFRYGNWEQYTAEPT